MITKERLKELIEQENKKIYYLFNRNNNSSVSNIEEYNNLQEFAFLILQPIDDIKENLFETKEEAEEYLEFGNIVREEKLKIDIPFNEFCELDNLIVGFKIEFTGKDGASYMLYTFGHKDIILWNQDDNEHIVFEKPLTKENYNEVRRLCKKLFMGE